MFARGIVKLEPADLTGGKVVAGTGTIDTRGVGLISIARLVGADAGASLPGAGGELREAAPTRSRTWLLKVGTRRGADRPGHPARRGS
jgi:hypothetical protein